MLPKIKDVEKEIKAIKKYVLEPDETAVEITLGWLEKGKDYEQEHNKKDASDDWVIQVGDNSFSGSAYFYIHWTVDVVTHQTNCRILAKDMIHDLENLYCQ